MDFERKGRWKGMESYEKFGAIVKRRLFYAHVITFSHNDKLKTASK